MSVSLTLGRIDANNGFRVQRIDRIDWGVRKWGFEVSLPTGHYATLIRK